MRKDVLKNYYLKHSILALLGLYIVHFQLYTDYVFGNIEADNTFIWVDERVVVKGVIFSTIGLICFLMGYKVFGDKVKISKASLVEKKQIGTKWMVFLAGVSLLVFFATVNMLYLAGFYGAEEKGEAATYASLFLELLFFAIMIQNCRNMILTNAIPNSLREYIAKQGYVFGIILVLYLLSVVMSGDRGPIMTFGLCYISGYFYVTKKTISLKKVLVFVFIGASVVSILGQARDLDKRLSFSEKIQMSLNDEKGDKKSFLPQTEELAGSVRTLHTTLTYIPEKHDFLYGLFQVKQVLICVPFVSIFNPIIFKDSHIKYATSSNFITWINQGDYPYTGDGTTCMADFYFDFGLLGIIVGMFFFGYFIRYCELQFYSGVLPSLFIHVFIIVYLCEALYIARSSVLYDLKSVVWVFILLIINKRILNKI
ncbi:MAG: O-antigen polymerase [Flavobacterium sp.]